MTQQKYTDYWKDQSDNFSKFYRDKNLLSPKIYVSKFLDARTTLLTSMMKSSKNKTILDLGCGSGVHIQDLVPHNSYVAGIDFSKQVLISAQENLSEFDRDKWSLSQADAQHLPLGSCLFHSIISMGLLDYVSSPYNVLLECNRVLKQNGELLCTIPRKPSLFFWLRTSIGNSIKRSIFDLPPINNILSRTDLMQLLSSTGFQLEEIDSVWTAMWLFRAVKK